VVIAETGVIATLIRFHQQTILSGLGNYISDRLKTVPLKVRVKVASLPEGLKTPTRSPIPPGQAADTLEAAARIVSDQDLSRSLKRLAQRAVKRH